MGRSFEVQSAGGLIKLDGSTGVRARLQVRGTGMAPVANQWFEGAGDGASYRGGRVLSRMLDLPVKVEAPSSDPENRGLVRQRFADLARVLSQANAPGRLTLDLDVDAGNDRWFIDVAREGGGDWDWKTGTDGRSFIHSVFSFRTGDPMWTSVDQESKVIQPTGVGLGILGVGISLVQLRVGSVDGFGTTTISNTGEVLTYPTWTIEAPFSGFSLTSQAGEYLGWVGTVPKSSGYIVVDTKAGTVKDETGANRYGELDVRPKFWPVPPGDTVGSVVMAGAGAGTRATVVWNRRREVLF